MNLLSRIARRFVTPHDAASVVAKRALDAAQGDAGAAFASLLDAVEREDDRDIGRYREALARAKVKQLRAENALYRPRPLPRPVQASKARSAG